ncbi:MAG: hypothetical protein U0531_14490 [Dehalococcoidia bacterium]
MPRWVSAAEAMGQVRSGQRIYIQGGCAVPQVLIGALMERAAELEHVEIVHLHTEGPAPYTEPRFARSFRHNALFIGANTRAAVNEGRADFTPAFLSEIPSLLRGPLCPDVALIHVSPPDRHGVVSLGVSVDVAKPAAEAATLVIAQVNPRMPRTHGDSFLPLSAIDLLVEAEAPLPEPHRPRRNAMIEAIGRNVAALVPDGATLQLGIGAALGGMRPTQRWRRWGAARSRRPHRDVLRRRARPRRGRRHHRAAQERQPGKTRRRLRHGQPPAVRLRGR